MLIDKKPRKAIFEALRLPAIISRRNLLRRATIIAGSAAAFVGVITAADAEADSAKSSQKAADYQTSPKNGQRLHRLCPFPGAIVVSTRRGHNQPRRLVQALLGKKLKWGVAR